MSELKECPCCGNQFTVNYDSDSGCEAVCKCGLAMWQPDKDKLIAALNRRHEPIAKLLGENEHLRNTIESYRHDLDSYKVGDLHKRIKELEEQLQDEKCTGCGY